MAQPMFQGEVGLADKATQLIVAALTQAAAEPLGQALFSGKNEPGLFPATALARNAAQRCKDEGYLQILRQELRGKTTREICCLTQKGLLYLRKQTNPRQVLEDFVRILEARHEQVQALLDDAHHMQQQLQAMRNLTEQLLPQLQTEVNERQLAMSEPTSESEEVADEPTTIQAPEPSLDNVISASDYRVPLLRELTQWHLNAGASEDCPLPELYRRLVPRGTAISVGSFHDCLRHLYDERQIYLHPWTGPLYDMPEPTFALLIGHEIAYYASVRL